MLPDRKKEVAVKQRETHKIYDGLVKLQEAQEKNLEGSASVIFFGKSCEDVCDWITEKSEKLELPTVKALQRKRKGLERELALVKDKVGQVSQLGADVIQSLPAERDNIGKRIAVGDAGEQGGGEESEDAVGMQLFTSGVRTLLQWVDATVRNVQTAEQLLHKHAEVGDEIRAKQDEFTSLISLGQKMYIRQPTKETEEQVQRLGEERKAVLRGWQEKAGQSRSTSGPRLRWQATSPGWWRSTRRARSFAAAATLAARRTWPASGLTCKTQASGRGRDCTRPTPSSSTCTAATSPRVTQRSRTFPASANCVSAMKLSRNSPTSGSRRAEAEVSARIEAVLTERQKLHTAWQH